MNKYYKSFSEQESLLAYDGGDQQNPEKKPEEPKPPVPISYHFLDGLRGFGAFSVYLSHFMLMFYPFARQD